MKRIVVAFVDFLMLVFPVMVMIRFRFHWQLPLSIEFFANCWSALIMTSLPFTVTAAIIHQLLKLRKINLIKRCGSQIFYVVLALSALSVAGGYVNARSASVVTLNYTLPKTAMSVDKLKIVAISDLHAGKLVTVGWVKSVVDKINSLKPDLILLLGDIIDDKNIEKSNILAELSRLKANHGVYAVTGNHEYYLNVEWSKNILNKIGAKVLSDQSTLIADSLLLVGRRDRAAEYFGESRLNLRDIIGKRPPFPVILMDHTPKKLEEAAESGVFLQLSGHTHNGQLFPFNFVTGSIYEQDWGSYKKGNTNYYISCGVGVWGPPLRTSSRPEILEIDLKFE